MSADLARIGKLAMLALVALRLCIGWQFFQEGTKKLEPGSEAQTAAFFLQAKGPLAPSYHALADDGFHGWHVKIDVACQDRPLTAVQESERLAWASDYARRQKEAAADEALEMPIEVGPFTPYRTWYDQFCENWQRRLAGLAETAGFSAEQRQAADAALAVRLSELADFLSVVEPDIVTHQHELFRLEQFRRADSDQVPGVVRGGAEVPFQYSRIAEKEREVKAQSAAWRGQLEGLEAGLKNELEAILTPAQQAGGKRVLSGSEDDLRQLHLGVGWLLIGVGCCLLLGFLTPLAAIAGAGFLVTVIAAQPPWVPGTIPTYNQFIEFFALLVLAATSAGRWAGLDYFLSACCRRCCGGTPGVDA